MKVHVADRAAHRAAEAAPARSRGAEPSRLGERADTVLRWAALVASALVIVAVCEPLWADDAAAERASPSQSSDSRR